MTEAQSGLLLSSAFLLRHWFLGQLEGEKEVQPFNPVVNSTGPSLSIHAHRSSWRQCFVGWRLGSKPVERWPHLYFRWPVPASDTRECCGGTVSKCYSHGWFDQTQVRQSCQRLARWIWLGLPSHLVAQRPNGEKEKVEHAVVQDGKFETRTLLEIQPLLLKYLLPFKRRLQS